LVAKKFEGLIAFQAALPKAFSIEINCDWQGVPDNRDSGLSGPASGPQARRHWYP
jgi:hypothetical protein